mmetsp:Transcript_1910/g.5026  ORF Transcript_1910/g.5026 Transcript_1910/m.5026 type:complete len:217 (+) Transcript_1910:302-952(+)
MATRRSTRRRRREKRCCAAVVVVPVRRRSALVVAVAVVVVCWTVAWNLCSSGIGSLRARYYYDGSSSENNNDARLYPFREAEVEPEFAATTTTFSTFNATTTAKVSSSNAPRDFSYDEEGWRRHPPRIAILAGPHKTASGTLQTFFASIVGRGVSVLDDGSRRRRRRRKNKGTLIFSHLAEPDHRIISFPSSFFGFHERIDSRDRRSRLRPDGTLH